MKIKNVLLLAIKIIVTILLFFYINKTINFSNFPQINNIYQIFIIAILFGIVQQFFLFLRWKLSCRAAGIQTDRRALVKSYFIGQFLGTISPARSGDAAKIFYINAPKKQGVFALICDTTAAGLTLFITGLWKNYHINSENAVLIADKILTVTGITTIIITIILFLVSSKINLNKTDLIKLFFVSIFQNIIIIIQGALIFSILLSVSFLEASFAVASAYCIMPLIPFTIAAIGVREFSLSIFIAAFIDNSSVKPVVFAVSYILLLCNSVLFMLPGMVLFYKAKRKV